MPSRSRSPSTSVHGRPPFCKIPPMRSRRFTVCGFNINASESSNGSNPLFTSNRLYGVEAGGAHCGNHAGDQSDGGEDEAGKQQGGEGDGQMNVAATRGIFKDRSQEGQ